MITTTKPVQIFT